MEKLAEVFTAAFGEDTESNEPLDPVGPQITDVSWEESTAGLNLVDTGESFDDDATIGVGTAIVSAVEITSDRGPLHDRPQ